MLPRAYGRSVFYQRAGRDNLRGSHRVLRVAALFREGNLRLNRQRPGAVRLRTLPRRDANMQIPCIFGKYAYGDRLGRAGRQPMLLLRLRGGLGNQLFQYAAGRALALRNHVPLWLDPTSGFRGDPYGRSYDLGGFDVLDEGSRK